MNILVTGGAGYIGSVLVRALLRDGHHVTVVDNFMHRQNSLAECCWINHFDVVCGDARDPRIMGPLVKKADVVIPLAAIVGAPACDRDLAAAHTINYEAIVGLPLSPAQHLILPITNSGYGVGEPGKECTEESPMRPVSLYAKLKVDLEKRMMQRERTTSLRFATVFGMSPRMRLDLLVNDFVYRAVHDRAVVLFEADFKRNYIHVLDAAWAFQHVIKNSDAMAGQVYNVGLSDANLSKWELCELIKARVPEFTFVRAEHGKDPDQRDYIVSNAKIEAAGYVPSMSLDDGIVDLVMGCKMIRNTVYGNV